MRLKADLHLHTDQWGATWHGERPNVLAKKILDAGLDVFAITQHGRADGSGDVLSEIHRLQVQRKGAYRSIDAILGAELNARMEGVKFHVGCLFKGAINPDQVPQIEQWTLEDLERLKSQHNAVLILNHPGIVGGKTDPKKHQEVLGELLQTQLFSGIETANALCLPMEYDHKKKHEATARAWQLYDGQTREMRLASIGSSDTHHGTSGIGQVYTEFHGNTVEDLWVAIQARTTTAVIDNRKMACMLSERQDRALFKRIKRDGLSLAA